MNTKSQQRRKAKERFNVASKLEREYMHQLRVLTSHIDHLVRISVNTNMSQTELDIARYRIDMLMQQYSETLKPWARQTAEKIVQRIHKVDESSWVQLGRTIGRELKKELQDAPTGNAVKLFLDEQVRLITSLPLDAAKRVHEQTLNGITEGTRAADIAEKILGTGKVTESRAMLIARTEVARTASALTMARATHIGATHYYWRTSADGDVRASHKKMNGKICEWANPPKVEGDIEPYHAGMIYNCRCYAEPILDEI